MGDPEPGHSINLFARSLAKEHSPLEERQTVTWLVEKSNDAGHVKTFPTHQRQLKFDGQSVEMCEAFWGDLSCVHRGWVGVVQGIFQIIFGLRNVAYVAADQPGVAAFWLKRLGLISSRMLHGPVLGVTFYLVILMMAICGTQMLWPDSYKSQLWPQCVLIGCSIVALAIAGTGYRLTRSRVIARFWSWVKTTTLFVTGLMLLKIFWLDGIYPELTHVCPDHPGLLFYCHVLLVLLGLLWFTEIQILIAMAGCWFVALLHPRAHRPGLHAALLIPALAVGIWGQVIPLMWVTAKEGLGVLTDLKVFADVFDDALPFLGVQLMMMVVIMLATSVLMIRYFLWRRNASVQKFNQGSRAPRLIVNNSLQVVLAGCTAVGCILVSSLCVLQMLDISYQEYALGRLMVEANKYAVSVLVPMGGLVILMIPKLRPVFDMLLDAVNHFYFRPTKMDDALDDDDEFNIAETTFENGKLFFSRRDSLHLRLKRILTHYRDQYTHNPELVIVAHSQGTMIAIEALNDEELAWLNNSFRSVSLITMGSPFSHIYQHYFGHFYPSLDQPFWTSLRRRIDNWTNICRIDDFVGTEIRFPNSSFSDDMRAEFRQQATQSSGLPTSLERSRRLQSRPIEYSNHAVGRRGHTSYWSDHEVLAILREQLFGKSDSEKRSAA